ncbi:hypothetical protein CNYM01_04061, partial [Colletotrichum nymphaeae SA-01]
RAPITTATIWFELSRPDLIPKRLREKREREKANRFGWTKRRGKYCKRYKKSIAENFNSVAPDPIPRKVSQKRPRSRSKRRRRRSSSRYLKAIQSYVRSTPTTAENKTEKETCAHSLPTLPPTPLPFLQLPRPHAHTSHAHRPTSHVPYGHSPPSTVYDQPAGDLLLPAQESTSQNQA